MPSGLNSAGLMGIFFNGIRSVQTVRACLFYWQVYSALVSVIFG
ncbi:hypothetical protein VCHE16_2497 [Vibrio paracholerae HE-16]|nr:hypothetical protein VCHE16_2497 [Vibrio paracholerae HE-16]